MAKKKKRKDENIEPKGYVIELKGIFLVLISIIGMTINTKYTHESIRQSEKNIEDNKKYSRESISITKDMS